MVTFILYWFLILQLLCVLVVLPYGPAFAFTYTDGKNNADFFNITTSSGYKAIYIYAGDVETICRGVQGTAPTKACYFVFQPGHQANSYVYYTDYAKQTAAKYSKQGFDVYLNWDGRIGAGPKGSNTYVANFSAMNMTAIEEMANITSSYACNDDNVKGIGWDVEPFNNNQVKYFNLLSQRMKECNKQWGIFAFPNDFNENMWNTLNGTTGFVMDSSYDLSTPCMCIEPDKYQNLLTTQLNQLKLNANKYNANYQIVLSGSGTTTIYTNYTGGNKCLGGGIVYNYTCPYTMKQWMQSAVNAMNNVNVKQDKHFLGVVVYDYTIGNNGGFMPNVPNNDELQVIKDNGYWNGNQ
eukprot:96356_1